MIEGLAPADVTSLASALVDANDQLLAFYAVADATNSLDERQACTAVLERSASVLSAEAMMLTSGDTRVAIGAIGPRSRLITGTLDDDQVVVATAEHASGLQGELAALRTSAPFTTGDRKMLAAILRLALGSMSTARLHQQVLRQALDERDRHRAAEIAQLALPGWRPDVADADLFVSSQPARETGGDLFCFGRPGRDPHLRFVVGDVSGKGLTAAVMMTTVSCAANAAFTDRSLLGPADQMAKINEWTHDHLAAAGLFTTLLVGDYRADDGELWWSNAGHSPCLIHQAAEDRWVELTPHVPPIGVLPDPKPRADVTTIEPGDLLVVGSDGLVEQENPDGERFGDQRLCDVLAADPTEPVAETGERLFDELERFAGGTPRLDDRTLLLLRRRA